MSTETTTLVTEFPPALPEIAQTHFEGLISLETDCWDVHESMRLGPIDFVLLDVRGASSFSEGHIEGATHIPHVNLTNSNLAIYPLDTIFVVYCAGPHCNGADKAAARLSQLRRPVKKMLGGIEGWKDEGFALVTT